MILAHVAAKLEALQKSKILKFFFQNFEKFSNFQENLFFQNFEKIFQNFAFL